MKSMGKSLVLVLILLLPWACTTTPDAEELPDNESLVQEEHEPTPPAATPGEAQESAWPVTRLRIKGVRGARITFEVSGTPDFVVKALLDFSGDADHRSWVKSFSPLERRGEMDLTQER